MKAILMICVAVIGLAGCNTTGELVKGPDPVKVVTSSERLACVASQLSPSDKQVALTVLSFPDQTGKESTSGNDSTGAFNTQGAASMLNTILVSTGVTLVNNSPSFTAIAARQGQLLDAKGKKSRVVSASVAIEGGITSTDFIPGSGAKVDVVGFGGGVFHNEAVSSMDMWASIMPTGDKRLPTNQIVAGASVRKNVVQGGVEISINRFMGGTLGGYVALEAGAYYREPMQYSARSMLEFLVADILAQIFKIEGCLPPMEPANKETMIAAAK